MDCRTFDLCPFSCIFVKTNLRCLWQYFWTSAYSLKTRPETESCHHKKRPRSCPAVRDRLKRWRRQWHRTLRSRIWTQWSEVHKERSVPADTVFQEGGLRHGLVHLDVRLSPPYGRVLRTYVMGSTLRLYICWAHNGWLSKMNILLKSMLFQLGLKLFVTSST